MADKKTDGGNTQEILKKPSFMVRFFSNTKDYSDASLWTEILLGLFGWITMSIGAAVCGGAIMGGALIGFAVLAGATFSPFGLVVTAASMSATASLVCNFYNSICVDEASNKKLQRLSSQYNSNFRGPVENKPSKWGLTFMCLAACFLAMIVGFIVFAQTETDFSFFAQSIFSLLAAALVGIVFSLKFHNRYLLSL